jgi:hypothetical protein
MLAKVAAEKLGEKLVEKHRLAILVPFLAACSSEPKGEGGGETMTAPTGPGSSASEGPGEGPGTTNGTADGGTTNATTAGTTNGTADGDTVDPTAGPKFDVGGTATFCLLEEPGIYCSENVAITCGEGGLLIEENDCTADICVANMGCVECLDGQYTCMAEKVMVCNAAAVPPEWELLETCNPAAGEGCDLGLGACAQLTPLGTNIPTGEYYQFADFQAGATAFLGGYDVDSFEDRLYVLNYTNSIDVYEVELLDSDGDGDLEPNQHPNNPEASGAIEERTITFVETIPGFGTPSISSSEIFALEDLIYIGGSQITEQELGGGTSVIATPPGWASWFAQIGYDDINGVWYASNEGARRVFQHDANTNTWGIAFLYPELAGDHMDGLEVVTDPNTAVPYVYVSDMTSDFIGQYRMDPVEGWVQENLFIYAGTSGAPVEGMGFGALNHFWATAGSSVYEIGGGDLTEYVEPMPAG